jgi:ribose 1,5-bisphosphokinase
MSASSRGRFVYVMGPSGSGKDSVIGYARARHGGLPHVAFAHRYITRQAAAGGENHVELAPAEFLARRNAGCFALSWRSHGNDYGLGREIDTWMEAGLVVVANGSRAHFPQAYARYPGLLPVLVHVDPALLRHRLRIRDREGAVARADRLTRAAMNPPNHPSLVVIDNNGCLSVAGEAFFALLSQLRMPESIRNTSGAVYPAATEPTPAR